MSETEPDLEEFEITLNGKPHSVRGASGAVSVAQMLAALDLGDRRVAVEVAGEIVPRASHETHRLRAGDVVEVVTFVGGG